MMRSVVSCAVTILALVTSAGLFAQRLPIISYIIPDIGTSRFATYVEIIAPYDTTGRYGQDSTYLNNPGDNVRVVCVRPADTMKVKIGPINVGWDGRLISTMIFVDPLVAPNSADWRLLNPEFRIPIRVIVNGAESNIDTFYIVRPWPLGDISSTSERVFGEGALGRRSKRGAMLVDSLLIPTGQEYTFSLSDPDPVAPGNQAFLPVVLLSPSIIRGTGTGSAEINVSASGIHGGPGGGGGGGEYHNLNVPLTSGSAGGNGFTGGGPGGFNNNGLGIPPNDKQKPGVGSGQELSKALQNTRGSASLNGLPGGESTTSFENAGGGTGHPFGASGVGCNNNNSCTTVGGHGGGSGARESLRGGGAGYGEVGQSESGFDQGGRVYGNSAIVPLAGGSGGASGNPDITKPLSSSGGGGGGAISIHANALAAMNISARGGTGVRQGVRGGAGSGGGVIVGARIANPIPADAITVQVSPGNDSDPNPNNRYMAGGRGRSRFDGGVPLNLPVSIGHVTDTMTNALRTATLRGHGNGSDLRIYIKPENGPWQLGPLVSNYVNGTSGFWRANITWPGKDTLYYVAVGQAVPNRSQSPFTKDPDVFFSQSAWNIVRIYGPPIISGPRNRDLGLYQCPGETMFDTVWISNKGESPLEISSASFTAANGFRLAAPTAFPDTILPFDSTAYVIEYLPAVGQTGVVTNTLRLANSDTSANANPFDIAVRVNVQLYDFTYSWRGIRADTLEIGTLCVGTSIEDIITIRNIGTSRVTIVDYKSADPSNVILRGGVPQSVDGPLGFAAVTLRLRANTVGRHVTSALVYLSECSLPDTIWIAYTGAHPVVTAYGSPQFGPVASGTTAELVMELRNTGFSPIDVPALPALPAGPFRVVDVQPSLPATLDVGQSVFIRYAYQPTAPGQHNAVVVIKTDSTATTCPANVEYVLSGRSENVPFTLSASSLVFGSVLACDSVVDSVVVTNTGGSPITLTYPAYVGGEQHKSFRIVSQPLNDVVLDPGASISYVISFRGDYLPEGVHSGILAIRVSDAPIPQIMVPMSGIREASAPSGPRRVDLGVIPYGVIATRTLAYTNTTANALAVSNTLSSRASRTTSQPATFSLADGVSTNLTFSVTANTVGPFADTLRLLVTSPCADTVAVIVSGVVVSDSISLPEVVNAGVVAQCATTRDSIVYVNTQRTTLDLIDLVLTGRDATFFRLENPGVVSNQTLGPGESRTLYVVFDPRTRTDGEKVATVTTRARINGTPVTLEPQVRARLRSALAASPDEMWFGIVNLAATKLQRLTIYNRSSVAVNVTRVSMAGSSGGAFIVESNPAVPQNLPAGGSIELQVAFTPSAQQLYVDSVLVQFDQPCAGVRVIPVSGTGRLNVEVELTLPTATLSPALEDYRMPIRARVVNGATDINDGRLTMTIRFASQVFAPRSISTGTIDRYEVSGGVTELDITIPSFSADGTGAIIGEIVGDMTLGDTARTDLEIVSAVITSSTVTPFVRPRNGELTLDICEEGGSRLIRRSGSLGVVVSPNPVTENSSLRVEVYERGAHTVDVVDVTGSVVWTRTIESAGARLFSLPIDMRSMPSGNYQVILRTPSRMRTTTLTILH